MKDVYSKECPVEVHAHKYETKKTFGAVKHAYTITRIMQ